MKVDVVVKFKEGSDVFSEGEGGRHKKIAKEIFGRRSLAGYSLAQKSWPEAILCETHVTAGSITTISILTWETEPRTLAAIQLAHEVAWCL